MATTQLQTKQCDKEPFYVPLTDFAHGLGGFHLLPLMELLPYLSQEDQDLVNAMLNDDHIFCYRKSKDTEDGIKPITPSCAADRYARCQSGAFGHEFLKPGESIHTHFTCDLRFLCSCPACVSRRKNRVYRRFFKRLSRLYDPTYRKALNLRAMTLTADLDFISRDDITKIFEWFVELVNQEKRILSSIPAVHLDGNKIHLHVIYYGFFIPQKELSDLWMSISGFPVVDIRAIKDLKNNDQELTNKNLSKIQRVVDYEGDVTPHFKGVCKALRYLVSYLVKPITLKDMSAEDKLHLFKETYRLKLMRPHGKHFRGFKTPATSWSYNGVVVNLNHPLLNSLIRNNSLSDFENFGVSQHQPGGLKQFIDIGGG